MKCPHCDKEMTAGFLQWHRDFFWTVKKSKFPPNSPSGSITFHDNTFLGLSQLPAYDCRTCQKVMLDYDHDSATFVASTPAD